MVRTRTGFTPTTSAASSMQNIDQAALLAAMQSGQDINQFMADMQAESARKNATSGILTVRLSRAMPIQQSKTTGRWYCLGSLVSAENVTIQGGRTLTPAHLTKLGAIEIDLGVSESLKDQIEDYRQENGGSHQFELVLDGESQVTQLQARFPKGHEDATKNIFLADSDVDATDVRNWTTEDTGMPLMKFQLRAFATSYLSATQAVIPGISLPTDDAEFDAFLTNAGKVSSVLSTQGLNNWRKARELATASVPMVEIVD